MAIVKLDKIQSVNINSLPIRVPSDIICKNDKKISYCLFNSKFKNRNYNFISKQEFFISIIPVLIIIVPKFVFNSISVPILSVNYCSCSCSDIGSVNLKVLPFPNSDSTLILPPIFSTNILQMDNPNPAP